MATKPETDDKEKLKKGECQLEMGCVALAHACALSHTQSHVHVHTHVLSHTHSRLTYSRVCSHTYVLSHARALTCPCMLSHTHTCSHTRVLACSHTHVLRAGTDKAASLPLVPWKDVVGPQSGEGAGPLLAPALLGCPSSQGFHSRSLGVQGWPQPSRARPAGRGRSSLSRVPTQFCLPELAALPPNHQAALPATAREFWAGLLSGTSQFRKGT